jgi:hypothetical protein
MKLINKTIIINHNQPGNALITLLFFMVIGITVITATALVLSANIAGVTTVEQGTDAYYAAESGAENGLLYLLRNTTYSGTLPTFSVGTAQASVTITSGIITSTGTSGKSIKKIQIQTLDTNGALSVLSWKEIN